MITFILICLSSAFVVIVAHNQFHDEDSPFFSVIVPVDKFLTKYKLTFFSKPLYDCMICMSSVWGAGFSFLLSLLFADFGIFHILCTIPVIGGMVAVFDTFNSFIEVTKEDYELERDAGTKRL